MNRGGKMCGASQRKDRSDSTSFRLMPGVGSTEGITTEVCWQEERQQEVKKLDAGYTFDPHAGATYSFEHMSLAAAEERARLAETPHIVEAVNWTKSEGGEVHYNRYFAHSFDEALGLAVRLRIGFEEEVEEVISIRPATRQEAAGGRKVSAHFLELMPLAISSLDENEGAERGGSK